MDKRLLLVATLLVAHVYGACPTTPAEFGALWAARQAASNSFSEKLAVASYPDYDAFYTAFLPLTTDDFMAIARGIGTYGGGPGGRQHALEYIAASNFNLNGGVVLVRGVERQGDPVITGDTAVSQTKVTFEFFGKPGAPGTGVLSTTTFTTTTIFEPCGDRLKTVIYDFPDEPLRLLVAVRPNDLQLCRNILEFCDENPVYTDVNDCVEFMQTLPEQACGDIGEILLGNSKYCRFIHHVMAKFDPAVHCPHVSKTGGGKCVDTACKNGFSSFAEPNEMTSFTVNFNNGNE